MQWAADNAHGLGGGAPVLALDMYEHAYHMDFGAKGASNYVDTVMRNLHWDRIGARFARATASREQVSEGPPPLQGDMSGDVPPERLRDILAAGGDVLVLDVCLTEDRPKRTDTFPGALFRTRETLADWVGEIPTDRPVVVSCMYGFQVSREAVAELRKRGVDASPLSGGIAAWHAIGAPTAPLVTS